MDEEIPGCIELVSYFDQLPKGICGTGDSFETGLPKVSCDLVDMEGYALAKVCKKLGYAWYLSNILVMVPTPQHIWIGKIICCWERINC